MFARIYSRCAAVFAIGLAAGQPFFPGPSMGQSTLPQAPSVHAATSASFISGNATDRASSETLLRQNYLQDLVRRESVSADINDVLKDPRKYGGQKIRIVGTIASGFEYAAIVDLQGKGLGIWPKYEPRIAGFPEYANNFRFPPSVPTTALKPHEFLGYLDWGGGFGHMGATPFQFTIIEMYPADMEKAGKAALKKKYLEFLENRSYDWPIPDLAAEFAVVIHLGCERG
jgi:hypothetical protein